MHTKILIDMAYSALFTGVILELVLPHQEIMEMYYYGNRRDLIIGGICVAMWFTYKNNIL